MSMSKFAALSVLLAVAEARFGQEQVPVAAVSALGDAGFGDPGVAATIAGSIPGSLLAAASPCQKLEIADQMIAELGNDPEVVDAAIGLVSAETNFNPFAVDVPFVCADPALPATEALRGITPLVDPAVDGSDIANAASEESVTTPFDATGLSQAEVLLAQGFASFTAVDATGANIVLDGQEGGNVGGGAGEDVAAGDEEVVEEDDAVEDVVEEDDAAEDVVEEDDAVEDVVEEDEEEEEIDPELIECGNAAHPPAVDDGEDVEEEVEEEAEDVVDDHVQDDVEEVEDDVEEDVQDDVDDVEDDIEEDVQDGDNQNDNQGGNNQDGNQDGNQDDVEEVEDDAGDDAGDDAVVGDGNLDFGICTPTMARVGGLNGRPADEFTFIPQDPLVAEGQQEALNPNIITNRICDQLINVCEADEAAIAACEDAQAEIEALGTRDQSTADTWNALLGFAGADSSVETI